MIRNVVFDLGNVLINNDPWDYILSLGYDEETSKELNDRICQRELWTKMDLGNYDSISDIIEEFIAENMDLETEIRSFFSEGWMQLYRLIPQTERFLNKLFNQGYHLYILSNYSREGFEYIAEKYDFVKKIKGGVVSADVHCIKPNLKIYDILLEKYNLNPCETVFIDDCEENIIAAGERGIYGIVFSDANSASEEIELFNTKIFEIERNTMETNSFLPMTENELLGKLEQSRKHASEGKLKHADDAISDMRLKYNL